jgi:hypothetical protein
MPVKWRIRRLHRAVRLAAGHQWHLQADYKLHIL